MTGVRDVDWSELAVHCGLFVGRARSLYVAAYGIDGLQGELSGLLVRNVSDLEKAGELVRNVSDLEKAGELVRNVSDLDKARDAVKTKSNILNSV